VKRYCKKNWGVPKLPDGEDPQTQGGEWGKEGGLSPIEEEGGEAKQYFGRGSNDWRKDLIGYW